MNLLIGFRLPMGFKSFNQQKQLIPSMSWAIAEKASSVKNTVANNFFGLKKLFREIWDSSLCLVTIWMDFALESLSWTWSKQTFVHMVGKKRLKQCARSGKAAHAYQYIYLEQEKCVLHFWDIIFSPLAKVSLTILHSVKSGKRYLFFPIYDIYFCNIYLHQRSITRRLSHPVRGCEG